MTGVFEAEEIAAGSLEETVALAGGAPLVREAMVLVMGMAGLVMVQEVERVAVRAAMEAMQATTVGVVA